MNFFKFLLIFSFLLSFPAISLSDYSSGEVWKKSIESEDSVQIHIEFDQFKAIGRKQKNDSSYAIIPFRTDWKSHFLVSNVSFSLASIAFINRHTITLLARAPPLSFRSKSLN